jgi:ubiquinol-cytochrome c reductase cytochrome b/c1 subunit
MTCALVGLFFWRMRHPDPMQIVPPWYVLPFFAILRAIPNKLAGLLALIGAVFGGTLLPWLLASNEKSTMLRPIAMIYFVAFCLTIVTLFICGAQEPDSPVFSALPGLPFIDGDLNSYIWLSRFATAYYFAYIALIVPILGRKTSDLAAA